MAAGLAAELTQRPFALCDSCLVFERFTETARQVVVLAQEEARALHHDYIGTEHLLLGLLREQEGLAAHVLASLDLTVERVRGQVVRIIEPGEVATSGQIPFTPRSKRVLEAALREALSLGHNHIGPEHILLALVRESDGVGSRILLDFDATPEKVQNAVARALSGPRGRLQPGAIGFPGGARRVRPGERFGPVLDWVRANMLWRPEGLELRVPLNLNEGAMATFAADEVWSKEPLASMRRELWNGWLSLASPALLEEIDAAELRCLLDEAAKRALDVSGRERGRVEDFLRRLRDGA
jgi:hypothetical protein